VDKAVAEALQEDHAGINEEMYGLLGKQGVVDEIDADGDITVTVVGSTKSFTWNSELIEVTYMHTHTHHTHTHTYITYTYTYSYTFSHSH